MPVTTTQQQQRTPTTEQLTKATQEARRTARLGLRAEDTVRDFLRSVGHLTVDSTEYENRVLDIDCRHAVTGHGISIKMQNMGVHTGKLCFETKRFNMSRVFRDHDKLYSTSDPLYQLVERESKSRLLRREYWEPSWYEYGQADWYIIGVGERYYKLKRVTLHDYVNQEGWTDYCSTVSSKNRLQHYGREYTDYQIGLLYISELLHNNVMSRIK